MTINDLKRATKAKFSENGIADGDNAILEMLFGHAFGFSRNFIISEPGHLIDEESEGYKIFEQDLQLLLANTPIQHIVGFADFCGLKFKVNGDVLIPRQETEILVKIALHFLRNHPNKTPAVADVCCGSGAIGIAVKKYCLGARVTMTDISPLALRMATANADEILGSSKAVTFMQGSFIDPLIESGEKFDCFLSNPPYIKTSDIEKLPNNVKNHDPLLALDGGENGVIPYDVMIPNLYKVLNDGALVCFEIGETQGEYVKDLMVKARFSQVEIVKDLCDCDRFVCGKYTQKKLPEFSPTDPIIKLPGIGPKSSEAFHTMGVYTVHDLAQFYPKSYDDRTQIISLRDGYNELLSYDVPGAKHTYKLKVKAINEYGTMSHRVIVLKATDGSMDIRISFFNSAYVKTQIAPLKTYYFYGEIVEQENGTYKYPQIINPQFIDADSVKAKSFLSVVPVYRTRNSVKGETIRKSVAIALNSENYKDDLTDELLSKYSILPYSEALQTIHFPKSTEDVSKAVRRLAFDELLALTLKVSMLKASRDRQDGNGYPFEIFDDRSLLNLLPYKLTNGQTDTINKIKKLVSSSTPMNLLVIGDVGSGKTVIALSAIYQALKNGKQAALMVPSTVLADQHYKKLKPLLESLGFETELLHSGVSLKDRKRIAARVAGSDTFLVVGTHALIQENVNFSHLGLVVTDEQHRFGVNQRKNLIGSYEKAPHVLSLSATPIPRTLALIIYGDMDICYLKEKPVGRKPISTILVEHNKKRLVYKDALEAVKHGNQVFIVHSCIEDPLDELDLEEDNPTYIKKLKSCVTNYNDLIDDVFKSVRCGLLHGKMKNEEKEAVMTAFAKGEIDVLFSTTVIEVGIDVPNATMMIIENAERFGLSQLHQLRGRVGRGSEDSYCFLISENPKENKRLEVLAKSSDGFVISEEDLKLRGPGELFGTQQSGMPLFKLANPLSDKELLNSAVMCSKEIIEIANNGNEKLIDFVNKVASDANNIVL